MGARKADWIRSLDWSKNLISVKDAAKESGTEITSAEEHLHGQT